MFAISAQVLFDNGEEFFHRKSICWTESNTGSTTVTSIIIYDEFECCHVGSSGHHHICSSLVRTSFLRYVDSKRNEKYVFSLSSYDWFGVISIILHTIFLLHLMQKFDYFGPFRTVKSDFQTNFLLFVSLFSLFNVFIHGKLMIGLFLC